MAASDTAKNYDKDGRNSQNQNKDPKNSDPNTSPYDSENLDKESGSGSKDISEKDIEKVLIDNDPSKGFETDIDKPQSIKDENGTFETIGSEMDNPVNKEFEIGQLGSEELQEDERTRDESDNDAVHFNKPSERKF